MIKRGRARLRKSLRRAQIRSALSGNSTMLVWLGKQYLGQSDRPDHSVSAEHKVISITPNVLERLHTSYRRTMEQLRTRGALPAATEEARGPPWGTAHRLSKTDALCYCEDSVNCGALSRALRLRWLAVLHCERRGRFRFAPLRGPAAPPEGKSARRLPHEPKQNP